MTRPFFSMGPKKSRALWTATSDWTPLGFGSSQISVVANFACTSSVGFGGDEITVTPGLWDAGDPFFTEDVTSETYDISATGPDGYLTGGIYDSASGAPLPTGMALSEAGILSVGTADVSTTTGVVFGYTEPGGNPTLTLHSTNAGTFPYMSAIYPCESIVPAGATLVSEDDTSIRTTILSTWEDGSAKVIVLAGQKAVLASSTTNIDLRPGIQAADTPLTAAYIDTLLTDVSTNFAGNVATFTNFSSPDRIWWANSQVICAQYRLALGLGLMEAIIVVHAYAGGRCFIEVLIENGKVDVTLTNPNLTAPTTQTYTLATVSVTPTGGVATQIQPGTGVSTLAVNGLAPNSQNDQFILRYTNGGHEKGRAWYCSGWTNGTTASKPGGAADPLIEVTHDTTSMQAHPWFFKPLKATTQVMQTKYAAAYDTYVPWAACRLRMPGMQLGGDSDQIAPLTMEQSDYIITGSKYAQRALIQTGLAVASGAIHYRHIDGTVPTKEQAVLRSSAANATPPNNWPKTLSEPKFNISNDDNIVGDASHAPAIALVQFMCRPSPLWIEQTQKNQVQYCTSNGHNSAGAHGTAQFRQRFWRNRDNAITVFLTPDSDVARKAGYRETIAGDLVQLDLLTGQSWNDYGVCTADDSTPPIYNDEVKGDHTAVNLPGLSRWGVSMFMHAFGAMALHMVNGVKVVTGATQDLQTTITNRICGALVQWIHGVPDGDYSWRAIPYQPTIGHYVGDSASLDNHGLSWTLLNAELPVGGTKLTTPGRWFFWDTGLHPISWDYIFATSPENSSNNSGNTSFAGHFFQGIMVAVERDLPGALSAYTKIVGTGNNDGGITNFTTWSNGYAIDPKMNRKARNLP